VVSARCMEIGFIRHSKQNAASRAFAITALQLLKTDYAAISGSVAFGPVTNVELMVSHPAKFPSLCIVIVAQNLDS
jgi:hypothetical protein